MPAYAAAVARRQQQAPSWTSAYTKPRSPRRRSRRGSWLPLRAGWLREQQWCRHGCRGESGTLRRGPISAVASARKRGRSTQATRCPARHESAGRRLSRSIGAGPSAFAGLRIDDRSYPSQSEGQRVHGTGLLALAQRKQGHRAHRGIAPSRLVAVGTRPGLREHAGRSGGGASGRCRPDRRRSSCNKPRCRASRAGTAHRVLPGSLAPPPCRRRAVRARWC